MINQSICEKIITIGCNYNPVRGGIAQLLYNYQKLVYLKFNFIPNSKYSILLFNLLYLIGSLFFFILTLSFNQKICIVHIHTASYNSFWRSGLFINISKFFKKKVVLHIHGGDFEKFYYANKKSVTNTLNSCDRLIVLSKYWYDFFSNISESPCIIIENLIETPVQIDKIHNNIIHFLFLGLICDKKGIKDLLDVIKDNHDSLYNKIELNIAGNGDVKTLKNRIVEYKIQDIVKYIGWVSDDEKKDILRRSDVFVLPSYAEGLPIAIIEAMSYSQAIIATDVGGIPEVVDYTNGILISPGDQDALYNSIETLVNDEILRTSLGNMSYIKSKHYQVSNVEHKLLTLYNSLL